MNSRADLARKAALQTGKTLFGLYQKGGQTGFLKEDHTLVTEADKAADKMIQKMILDDFPGDKVLSEEGSTIYPNSSGEYLLLISKTVFPNPQLFIFRLQMNSIVQ